MQPALGIMFKIFSKEYFLVVSDFLCYCGIADGVILHIGLQRDGSSGSTLVPLHTFRSHISVEGALMGNIAFIQLVSWRTILLKNEIYS